jgi:hypothetical protein
VQPLLCAGRNSFSSPNFEAERGARGALSEDTNTFDLPFEGPGTGVRIYKYIAKDGADPMEITHTEVSFRNPVMVGLAVCSHQADASDTVIFSGVSVESQTPPAAKAQ